MSGWRNFLTGLPITGFACLGPAWLLDDEVVSDVRHTGNCGGVFPCGGFLVRIIHIVPAMDLRVAPNLASSCVVRFA